MNLFILMLSFRLTTNTYMPTDGPVHQPTCAFSYFHSDKLYQSTSLLLYIFTQIYPSITIHLFSLVFPSGKARRITCQIICWSAYPETYLKINQGVYIDVFLPANHRDLPGRIKDTNYKNVQIEQ